MEHAIEQYLIEEKQNRPLVAKRIAVNLCKHEDIARAFLRWLEQNDYDSSLSVDSYTAKDIHEMAPFLDGVGVYSFMATLRDHPAEAKKIIKEGFVVR